MDKRILTFKVGCHGAVSGCFIITTFIKPSLLSHFTNHCLFPTVLMYQSVHAFGVWLLQIQAELVLLQREPWEAKW